MGLGQSILDAIDAAGYALDTPRALAFGLLGGQPGTRMGGRELLEHYGVLGPNQEGLDAGDVAGFGLEMALDPLNLLMGGGLASKAMKAARIKSANKLSKTMRAAGAMPEELVSKLHPSMLNEAGQPKRWYHGTGQTFDNFDPSKANHNSYYGRGFYLTDNPQIASGYAEKSAGSPNVRMHYLDVRSPVDARLPLDSDLANRLSQSSAFPAKRRAMFAEQVDSPRLFRENPSQFPGPPKNHSILRTATGDARNFDSARALRDSGIDAIQHEGGAITNGMRHNVTIALDPSQIYSPYIAPALQQVPSLRRRAAMLLAHNIAARKKRRSDY